MAVETAEDRAIFFDPEDFGTTALFHPPPEDEAPDLGPVNVLFDAPHQAIDPNTGVPADVAGYSLLVRTEDIPGVTNAWNVTVGGQRFDLHSLQPDGPDGLVTRIELVEFPR